MIAKREGPFHEIGVPLSVQRMGGGFWMSFTGDLHLTWSITLPAAQPQPAQE